MNHTWTLERVFSSYLEAAKYKNSILHSERGATLQVKIKLYSTVNGVERFGVKTRVDPQLHEAVKHVEEKTKNRQKKKD